MDLFQATAMQGKDGDRMNKAFEKILERLEEDARFYNSASDVDQNIRSGLIIAKETVQEVAEEYNNGWIPCSERLPSGLDFVLYTHKDGEVDICSIEYFYDYLDKFTAWQPLPEPFKERD